MMQSYCSLYCCFSLFVVALSHLNVVLFAGQPAGQEPLISAGQPSCQPAGLTYRLPVGLGHENLDRFRRIPRSEKRFLILHNGRKRKTKDQTIHAVINPDPCTFVSETRP